VIHNTPALLRVLKPPGEPHPMGFTFLAPVDRFTERHRVPIVVGTLVNDRRFQPLEQGSMTKVFNVRRSFARRQRRGPVGAERLRLLDEKTPAPITGARCCGAG
jgi:hypothetical protein